MKNAPMLLVLVAGLLVGSTGTYTYFQTSTQSNLNDPTVTQTKQDLGAEKTDQASFVWHYSNLRPEFSLKALTTKSRFAGPVFFSSYTAYRQEFAESYGFPSSYVADSLPGFVAFMSFDMKYAGRFNRCNLNLLVDKEGPIKLPETAIYRPFSGSSLNMMPAALPARVEGFAEQPYQRKYRLEQSEYGSSRNLQNFVHDNFALLGTDSPEAGGGHSFISTVLDVSKANLFEEWTFLSIRVGCVALIKNILKRDIVAVIARPNNIDFTTGLTPGTATEFLSVEIPDLILEPIRNDFETIDFEPQIRGRGK